MRVPHVTRLPFRVTGVSDLKVRWHVLVGLEEATGCRISILSSAFTLRCVEALELLYIYIYIYIYSKEVAET